MDPYRRSAPGSGISSSPNAAAAARLAAALENVRDPTLDDPLLCLEQRLPKRVSVQPMRHPLTPFPPIFPFFRI